MNIKDLLIGAVIGLIIGLIAGLVAGSILVGQPKSPLPEKPPQLTIPAGFIPAGPCFPGKGVHYINPELPQQIDPKVPAEEAWIGPTYLVNQITGEVNGFEYHIRADFLEAQAALLKITPEIIEKAQQTGVVETDWLRLHHFDTFGLPIKHFDIALSPGHEGYATAHYDIHLYTKSVEELKAPQCAGQP